MQSLTNEIFPPYPCQPYPKLIINACLTGMVPAKKDNPHLPVTPAEIIDDAIRCWRAGASIVHIHARDDEGKPSYKKDIYAQIIEGIRQQCPELILCVSTSGRVYNEFEQRSQVLELDGALKPDMASLTLGSLNFMNQASVSSPEMIEKLLAKMTGNGIVPELEIFDTGMINTAKVLMKKGLLNEQCYGNILLGSIYSAPATVFDLAAMVQRLPHGFVWSAAGIGKFQQTMNFTAMLMGGHVRVGLEDSVFYRENQLATNEMLIKRIVRFADDIGRGISTPQETRELLGIPLR
jgi:uncharacterized protein (DUF849 family)